MRSTKTLALNICFFLLASCGGGTTVVKVDSNNTGTENGNGNGSGVTIVATSSRLLNGNEVAFDASPQMVQISQSFLDGSVGLCSGVAIAPGTVLTAAHCFTSDIASNRLIAAGVSYPVDEIVMHPGFYASSEVSAFFNDVAIVRSKVLNIPTLPILTSLPLVDGEKLALYGSGIDENGNFGNLKNGSTSLAFVTENHLFSQPYDGSGVNACSGDSGGPAILGFTDLAGNFSVGIVGIISSGTVENCGEGDTTLFANLQNKDILSFIAAAAPGVIFN